MRIGRVDVGRGHPPFVVAEMSGNHNQSLQHALAIVEAAAEAGAHALKLQTYTPDTMTLDLRDGDFVIKDPESLWAGRSLYDLYKVGQTPWDWHEPIMRRAAQLGLVCFSTPFDASAVDFLETLEVPAYKVASFENTDLPLIRRVAAAGKPVLVSTGMATFAELREAVDAIRAAGNPDVVLLKCTSSYPASPADSDVLTIAHMREQFGCEVGLSDHTPGIGAAVAAVAHGASVIEKHFTLRRADGGIDAAFSLEPDELRALVVETRRAWESLGTVKYGPSEAERECVRFRRSLYVARDIKAGEALTSENLRSVRPGNGLPPKHYDSLLGRKVNRDLAKGTPMHWDFVGRPGESAES